MTLSLRQQKIVEWLKARTTYPRTGYVLPPSNVPSTEEAKRLLGGRKKRGLLLLVLVPLAVLALVAMRNRWTPSVAGIIVGVGMAISRKDYRWSWIIPLGFPIVGLCITFFVEATHKAPMYFCAGLGGLFFLDGATTLIRYLLQNPAPKIPTA